MRLKSDIREKKIGIRSNNIEAVHKVALRFMFSFANKTSAIGRSSKNMTAHDKIS